jgi:hypothetical protein
MGRNYLPTQAAMPSTPSSRRRIMARLLAALAVVGTLVEAVLLKTTIVANRHDQWLIHGPSTLLMVVLWFIIWRIERGERTTNAAPPRAVADQDAVAEIDRRIAAASDAASANIEATAVADHATVEEIGRRIAAMLVEKGILINSPKCELRRRANDGASANIEATAVADQDTVEGIDRRIAAVLAKKGILIDSPKCELRCAASAGASVNTEATAVAASVEEIGRRIVAMLAEKGILINSPNQSR